MWAGLAAVAVAFAVSVVATALAKRVARRVGFLDVPQGRKAHAVATPLLGGSGILLAVLLPSLAALAAVSVWSAHGVPEWLTRLAPQLAIHVDGAASRVGQALGVLAAAVALHVLGLVDDKKHLAAWPKLIAQMAIISAAVIVCDIRILTLLGDWPSGVVTILWLTVLTNSFNFLDNMDGLSAGVAAICAAALLAASASIGQIFVSAWACLLLGALLGFLPYNFSPASIYMGDAGSLVVGFLVGVISCLTTYVHESLAPYAMLVPLVVMAVPLYDTCSVVALRLRAGVNPMVGDRRHFSHRLVKRGMSTRKAVLTIYLCTAGTAIAATLLPRVDAAGAVLILVQTLAMLTIVAILESDDAQQAPKA